MTRPIRLLRAARSAARACAALAALGLCVWSAAGAQAQQIGYVLSNKPSFAGTIHPKPGYAFSSASTDIASIALTRIATGTYVVGFRGLGDGKHSNVQVTAFTSGTNYCSSGGWSSPNGTNVLATVYCFDLAGAKADTGFTLLYQSRTSWSYAQSAMAYFWANRAIDPSYNPDATWSFNSTGGTNGITRSGAGTYAITLPNVQVPLGTDGDVEVTAVSKVAVHCSTNEYGIDNAMVFCVDHAGNAVDSDFSLLEVSNRPPAVGAETPRGAYGFAGDSTTTSFYNFQSDAVFNNLSAGDVFGRENATGTYVVGIPGMPSYASSVALVNAFGGSTYCNIAGWKVANSAIYVNCFDYAGTPMPTAFTLGFQASMFK